VKSPNVSLDFTSIPVRLHAKSVKQFKQGAQVRQTTDHATAIQKWAALGKIDWARAILLNNTMVLLSEHEQSKAVIKKSQTLR